MILTPIVIDRFPAMLCAFADGLADDRLAKAVFARVIAVIPEGDLMRLSEDQDHHRQAAELVRRFGLGLIDVDPRDYFTWDGQAAASRMEPSVLIHEVAHYQLAQPSRRAVIDFGLGAGPETGRKAEANAVQGVFCPDMDVEEGLCSLLGILWEAELGQPAILAFLEQNWMEGGASPLNLAHFRKSVRWLKAMGLIDDDGRPTMGLRAEEDDTFFARWFTE